MATAQVRDEWGRRVVAEYRSAAHAHELTGWLIEVGASPDLIRDGLRVVQDELAHAEISAEVLAAAGGRLGEPVRRDSLRLPRTEPVELALARVTVDLFCLGETIAVPLFRRMLAGATEPVARAALKRIVADEARHRRFGWDLWQWLHEGPLAAELRPVIATELPGMIAGVRVAYGQGVSETIPDDARAWGLIAPAEYAAEFRRVSRDWWVPRFSGLTRASV